MPSTIAVLGLSHKTSPVEIREKLSIGVRELENCLSEIISLGAEESVVLSTCNRIEVYWAGFCVKETASRLRESWEKKLGQSLEGRIYFYEGFEAAHYLLRVASGLDSMVLGESQILGQVRSAYQTALDFKVTGKYLNRLFQAALHTGKLVRTETSISSGITSVASAAVALAERIFGTLADCRVMVLGAGKMAEAAAKHLISKKIQAIFVSNRTFERAQELASVIGAEAVSWEEGMSRVKEVDIVVCSTACPYFVVTYERARTLMKDRLGRPLFLIDIAVPRDVDPLVEKLDQVYLYDIDDLKNIVESRTLEKSQEISKAENRIRLELLKVWKGIFPCSCGSDFFQQGVRYPLLLGADYAL